MSSPNSGPTVRGLVEGTAQLRRLQSLGGWIVRAISRLAIAGADEIGADGPVILAMNHCSLWDGPLLCDLTPRPVTCLVKAEAFVPVVGTALRHAGQVPVHRSQFDPAPIRRCLSVLRAGGAVGIFPEGTRGLGEVTSIRPGVGYLALRSGAVVVPVAARGTGMIAHGRRPRVKVRIGPPIAFERFPDARPLNRRQVQEAAETVRIALAELVRETQPPATWLALPD